MRSARHLAMADATLCPYCGMAGGIHAERVVAMNREAVIKSRCNHCERVWTVLDGHERRNQTPDRRRHARKDGRGNE